MKRHIFLISTLVSLAFVFNGCDKDEVVPPVVCTPATEFTATNNSPVNPGSTVNLSVTSVEGATYSWTGPNGFTSSEQNPSFTYAAGTEGQYAVTVTVADCKSLPHYTYVVSCAAPIVSTNSPIDAPTVSEGGTITLSSTYAGEGAIYTWSGPNSFVSNEQSTSKVNVTMADSGVYSVSAVTQTCTTGTASVNVRILPPTPNLPGPSNAPITVTVGQQITIAPTFGTGIITTGLVYNWRGPNGFTATTPTISIPSASRANAGKYWLTVTRVGAPHIPSKADTANVKVNFSSSGCGTINTVTSNNFTYGTTQIGNQCWLRSNIKASATDSLFKWDEMMDASPVDQQGACPSGWHVPSDAEWNTLIASATVGGNGNNLKAVGQGSGAGAGTNASNFSATVPAAGAFFWTSSELDAEYAWYRQLYSTQANINHDKALKTSNYSVRCLKD